MSIIKAFLLLIILTVRPIIIINLLSVGHDFANLKTLSYFNDKIKSSKIHIKKKKHIKMKLTNLNDLSTDNPLTPCKPNSIRLSATIIISNTFQPSLKYFLGVNAIILKNASAANIAVNTFEKNRKKIIFKIKIN